ncbi:hypothetical protein Q4574_21220 [Aliiglaciecola sp. 3_MG-2023]|uniref:hypothetical protein n=1 Tax=Aliiglaciecola sp. 3_MG-2023 TaxID=3062644 RepID=UPI0026E40C91|nr:hypothetical protein [Aliiglaciecola sp. 3_MG-2023]MDO6695831.1 hypothetical protein [Aliiglaciecola sp. 3_MG-2023]
MKYLIVILVSFFLSSCAEPMKAGSNIKGEERDILIEELEKRDIEYEIWEDGTIRYDEDVQEEVSLLIMKILKEKRSGGS